MDLWKRLEHTVDGPEDEENIYGPIPGGNEEDEEWCEVTGVEQEYQKSNFIKDEGIQHIFYMEIMGKQRYW